VAELLEGGVFSGEDDGVAQGLVPLVGDVREGRVEGVAQCLNDVRERVAVVLVLAASEAVT